MMSRFLFGASWILASFCMSCGGNPDSGEGDGLDSALVIPRMDLKTTNVLMSTSGVRWVVFQTPMLDSSLVNITVEADLSGDTLSTDFGEVDPVLEIRLEDFDKDGTQELYLVTRSVSPEEFGTILGIYPGEGKSVGLISYEGATPYYMKEGEVYEGYRGHDRFQFQKGVLINTFPVYRDGDPDSSPTGGQRQVAYELVKGQTSMLLRPVKLK